MAPKLPPLPTTVPEFTRVVQDYFLRTDPKTGVLVTSEDQADALGLQYSQTFVFPNIQNNPRQTLALLSYFDRIDARIQGELVTSTAKEYGGIAAGVWFPLVQPFVDLGFFDDTGSTRENLVAAFNRWKKRKALYREIAETFRDKADGKWFAKTAEHTAYGVEVGGPLFLGWYPDAPQQTTLDAVTPMIIANMVGVAKASKESAWNELLRDLTLADLRDEVRPETWPAWLPWVAGGIGVAALGGVAYLATRRPRSSVATRDETASRRSGLPTVCGDVYGPLTTAERDAMASSTFGLPAERKYPMPDSSHAKNAKARAAQALSLWNRTNGVKGISPREYKRIADKADRIIDECAA